MDGMMNKTQFPMKRDRDRFKKKNKKEQRFNKKTKGQLGKTYTASQHMY